MSLEKKSQSKSFTLSLIQSEVYSPSLNATKVLAPSCEFSTKRVTFCKILT